VLRGLARLVRVARLPSLLVLASAGFLTGLVILSGFVLHSSRAASSVDPCDAPTDITADIAPLPHVAAVLKPKGTLNVLTVGSATVFSPSESLQPGTITGRALGIDGSKRQGDLPPPDAAAFPLQMARALEASTPGLTVKVTVRGGRGMMASEMLDIIRNELSAAHYDLVIWQTGTVEAVHNVPAGAFFQTLSDGAAAVAAAGADLVLVDPQYSRFLNANSDVETYLHALQETATQSGVVLFHRFGLMRHWTTSGQIDLERTPRATRLATVEQLHSCLGRALAHFVAASATASN
jgi:acyl-CoA thioesterase-1